MTKLLRALALVEVLNVVSIMCVDIGVVKGSVQSNHSVNMTLVYFNSTPSAWLSAFIHGSWLSDLFFFGCLFILFPPKITTCQAEVLHSSTLTFGYLWNTFFLVLRSTEGGDKKNKMHTIKLRNYWWTNPASCLLLSFPVSSLMHNILSAQQQCIWRGLQKKVGLYDPFIKF